MDDHMYDEMMDYAMRELIPRFRSEFQKHRRMNACPSYTEIRDFCKALNAVAPYAGFDRKTPSDFLPYEYRRY